MTDRGLSQLQSDAGTGLGIGERVVVMRQIVAALRSHRVELVIFQQRKGFARHLQGVEKEIIWIVHLINPEGGFQTTFVKAAIVRHQRQIANEGRDFLPHFAENFRVVGVFGGQSMDARVVVAVIIWFWLDESIVLLYNFSMAHHHDAHRTNATADIIGSFKVDGYKILHSCEEEIE